jgi:hypothetical protein
MCWFNPWYQDMTRFKFVELPEEQKKRRQAPKVGKTLACAT